MGLNYLRVVSADGCLGRTSQDPAHPRSWVLQERVKTEARVRIAIHRKFRSCNKCVAQGKIKGEMNSTLLPFLMLILHKYINNYICDSTKAHLMDGGESKDSVLLALPY